MVRTESTNLNLLRLRAWTRPVTTVGSSTIQKGRWIDDGNWSGRMKTTADNALLESEGRVDNVGIRWVSIIPWIALISTWRWAGRRCPAGIGSVSTIPVVDGGCYRITPHG